MGDQEQFIEREKEWRRQALRAFYEEWAKTDHGPGLPGLDAEAIASRLQISPGTAVRVLQHLREKRWLRSVADQYHYEISLEGREVVEKRFDEELPPPTFNIVQAGRDVNVSGILQQGQTNTAEYAIAWQEVDRLTAELRESVDREVDDSQLKDDAIADLDALSALSRKGQPDLPVAQRLLWGLYHSLQVAAALRTLYPGLSALADHLGVSLPPMP